MAEISIYGFFQGILSFYNPLGPDNMTFSQIRRTMFQQNCGHGYLCIYLRKLFLYRSPDLFRRLLSQTKTIQMQYPISVSAVSPGSYHELFYDCELTEEMYQDLIANALPQ